MRAQHLLAALGAVLVLSSCKTKADKPEEVPSALDVFPAIIMPPNASFVSKSGTKDALAVTLRTTLKTDVAANYYRLALRPPQWRLVSDAKDNQGATVLYAEHSGRPLWVRVWPDSEFNATFVEMTGAVAQLHPDSTQAPSDSEAIATGKLPAPAATFKPLAPPRMVR